MAHAGRSTIAMDQYTTISVLLWITKHSTILLLLLSIIKHQIESFEQL